MCQTSFMPACQILVKVKLTLPFIFMQLTRAYFAFLEVLFNSHITFILSLDTNTFMHIVGSLESGLKGLDTSISSQVIATYHLHHPVLELYDIFFIVFFSKDSSAVSIMYLVSCYCAVDQLFKLMITVCICC